ncbi:MAG TPA: cysteine desulfurase family protein [Bacteroidota bacterium]|nr:cysteine desulfurase family protein [Bacteroidota bacterium]
MSKQQTGIYLDHAATTPLDAEAASIMNACAAEAYGNASSIHGFGRDAKVILEQSRETIARALDAETAEVFFTSGGTESDNHALMGAAFAARRASGRSHLVVSAIEHHAVLHCAEYLSSIGFSTTTVPVDGWGVVDPDRVATCITPDTCIVSVMHVNNEIGTIQPIDAIAERAHARGVLFHTDAVQAVGKLPVSLKKSGADVMSVSAHKLNGPKGIGGIVIRRGTDIDALIHGGSQERKQRAGTENVPLVAAFACVIGKAVREREASAVRAEALRARLLERIQADVDGVILNGARGLTVPSIVSISLDAARYDIDGEALLMNMDLRGIAVSSGSACTSGSVQPSHVLRAMGRPDKDALLTIRFSTGRQTTMEEIERAADSFIDIARRFRK